MKGFLKVFGAIMAFFAVVVAALAIYDKITNKHRLKGDYLNCDVEGTEDEIEEFAE